MFARKKIAFALAFMVLCFWGPAWADELAAAKPETILVVVGGEVKNKGRYALPRGSKVMDAVDAAGGLTIYAPNKLRLIHDSQVSIVDTRKLRHDNSRGPVLADSDQIQVPAYYF